MSDFDARAQLRAEHTCILSSSSMRCRACARGTPYPALTLDEIAYYLRQGHEEAEAAVPALFGYPGSYR